MGRAAARMGVAALVAVGLALAGCTSPGSSAGSTTGVLGTVTSAATTRVQLFGPAEFEAAAAGRMLINVHVPDEGSLPGTDLALPYDEVDARVADLPADRATPLAIYCMSGNMSAIAGDDLMTLGYTDVVELDGGMQAWRASGRTLMPVGS